MCGKSMLGSLYLSILLISCISFDFGSANSSGEEIEEIVPIRPTPLECCKNAGVPEFCLGLCIPADAMARQRNRFNACAKYDGIIDGCYDQIQDSCSVKGNPGDGESRGTCGEGLFCFPDGSCKPGFIKKENYFCNCPAVGIQDTNLDEALMKCIANSQCKCVNYAKKGTGKYYGCGASDLNPSPDWDSWIKVN